MKITFNGSAEHLSISNASGIGQDFIEYLRRRGLTRPEDRAASFNPSISIRRPKPRCVCGKILKPRHEMCLACYRAAINARRAKKTICPLCQETKTHEARMCVKCWMSHNSKAKRSSG